MSSGKGHKNSEICKKISTKCRVFLSSGDFPSLMYIQKLGWSRVGIDAINIVMDCR
jgi:hypothetical protein